MDLNLHYPHDRVSAHKFGNLEIWNLVDRLLYRLGVNNWTTHYHSDSLKVLFIVSNLFKSLGCTAVPSKYFSQEKLKHSTILEHMKDVNARNHKT